MLFVHESPSEKMKKHTCMMFEAIVHHMVSEDCFCLQVWQVFHSSTVALLSPLSSSSPSSSG